MTSPTNATPPAGATPGDRPVALWLLACCAMIFAVAVIGAITRLTDSGLSIMEWAPVTGILPPLGEAEWARVFALYREIPEYQVEHGSMTLEAFKGIFWWEYVHRLWGRLIGIAFAAPFLWFLLRGRLRRPLVPHLVVMFLLGGLQGGLGWFMVASGFAGRTDVSQYRLVAHLVLALVIYGYLLWVALGLLRPMARAALDPALLGFAGLVSLTIVSGGFVAGLDAGFIYNSFPLMDGALLPPDYGALGPWFLNPSENPAAAQFNHRTLAIATLVYAALLWARSRRPGPPAQARSAITLVLLLALLQVALGILALLTVVPVWLGALHQAGAIALFTGALLALHRRRGVTRPRAWAAPERPDRAARRTS